MNNIYLLGCLTIIFSVLFTSCDPAVDGVMKITNNTDSTITVIITKSGDFSKKYLVDVYGDSTEYRTQYYYEYDENSTSTICGDTFLIVECKLPKYEEYEIYYEGPIGTLDLKDEESALFYLNEMSDTIYLKNTILKKNIKNMDNWKIGVDKYNNGGGKSLFKFIIENTDIEKYK